MIHRIFRLFATTVLMLIPCVLASEAAVYVNDTYNDIATNTMPENYSIIGATSKITETGEEEKAYLIRGAESPTVITRTVGEFSDTYTLSVDVRTDKELMNITFGIESNDSSMFVPFIKVNDNKIMTPDGRIIGNVMPGKFTTLTVTVHKSVLYDVYINGRAVLLNWAMKGRITNGNIRIEKDYDGVEWPIYIDNLRLYEGDYIKNCLPKASFLDLRIEQLNKDTDLGDYTYFDSTICNPSTGVYDHFYAYPRSNTIECHAYDYKNQDPDRAEYIYMKKTTSEDVYFDCMMYKWGQYNSKKVPQYFLIDGSFKVDKLGAPTSLVYLRDRFTNSYNVNVTTASILADGSLRLYNGTIIGNVVTEGEWFNYRVAVNLVSGKMDYYINNMQVLSDVSIPQNFKRIDQVRMSIDNGIGEGDLYIDDFTITGLAKPYIDGVDTKTSVFPKEIEEREFFDGKVAFHGYGKLMWSNNEKSKIETESVYDEQEQELYVDSSVLNEAFSLGLTINNEVSYSDSIKLTASGVVKDNKEVEMKRSPRKYADKILYPVCEFAEKVLGKHIFTYETGLMVIADYKINIDTSKQKYFSLRENPQGYPQGWTDIDFLNAFMCFERPDEKKLIEDFNAATNNGEVHPRILATKERFDNIKNGITVDEELKTLHENLLKSCDGFLNQETIAYIFGDKMRTLLQARLVLNQMLYLGYAWNTTGDDKYLEKGKEQLFALCDFPAYNTPHVIDSAEYNMALAIGYDWFYHGLTEVEREKVSDTILNKSLYKLALSYYRRLSGKSAGGISSQGAVAFSNYSTVVNNGCIAAALAVFEEAPEYCSEVIKNALRGLEITTMMYAPEGGWAEGGAYWTYTFKYYLLGLTSLINATQNDYGFSSAQGLKDTPYFIISLYGNHGGNNFHDASESTGLGTSEYYSVFADILNLPDVGGLRMKHLRTKNYTGANMFDLLYYKKRSDDEAVLPNGIHTKGVESVAIRESYDPDGTYFSAHFGLTSGYHTHNDTGTFVLDMIGTRWAIDLGSEDYNLFNEKGVANNAAYRKRAEGHNVVVINPDAEYNQTEGIFSEVERFEANEYGGYVIADMKDVYRQAPEMKLGYYVGDNYKSVTVRNEMKLKTPNSTVYWFMHTRADIAIDGDRAYLYQDGKALELKFSTNASKAELYTMDAVPLETSPNPPGQTENTGIKKIVIKLTASSETYLAVKLAACGTGAVLTPVMDTPLGEWTLPADAQTAIAENLSFSMQVNGMSVNNSIQLAEDEVVPTVEAVAEGEDVSIEIMQAKDVSGEAIVKVTDEESGIYNIGIVDFYVSNLPSIDNYNEIGIVSYTVNDEPEKENPSSHILDNDMTTRWTTHKIGDYAIFDLGSVQKLDAVAIAFWKGLERKYSFDIEVSEDGVNYNNVYSGASYGLGERLDVFPFGEQNTRYIKFINKGNTSGGSAINFANMLEFRALVLK